MATWDLYEEGCHYDTIEADDAAEALERAKANVHRANYPDIEGSMWIDVRVECEESGETASGTVRLDEPEPECSESEHSWASPYEVFGGLKENPGVWGHGGGVIIKELCKHCGCERTTDTRAQRLSARYTTVHYKPREHLDYIEGRKE